MAPRRIDIDPDGDTLIILPTIKAEVNDQEMIEADTDEATETSQVISSFKVSMKHLTLASPRAKKVLQGCFSESVPQRCDGLRHWKFDPMFDPDAFEIVLRIIHAQAHKLPKELSINTLTQVAVIADDLQCSAPVAPFVPQWSSNASFWATPKVFGELFQQLFICSVFRLKEKFSSISHTAIMVSTDKLSSCGLPIYPPILQAIKDQRASIMKEHLKFLYCVEKELEDDNLCWECRAENIGYLKFNLHLHRLPESESSERWARIPCNELKSKMKNFKYGTSSGCGYSGQHHPSLKGHIAKALKIFSSPDDGLDLSSFINTSDQ